MSSRVAKQTLILFEIIHNYRDHQGDEWAEFHRYVGCFRDKHADYPSASEEKQE